MAAVSGPGEARRLLAVHAHPDDECITTGGLLARCADTDVTTTVVTCTDGRYGPVNPELELALDPPALAETRAVELAEASRILGISRLRIWGHHDSNMAGLPQNDAPEAFWAQPIDELVAAMVEEIRRSRPQVVVTYDAFGATGHPDHIQAHRATMLAVAAAGQGGCCVAAGPVWDVDAVFYPVFPISALRAFVAEDERAGLPHPFGGRPVDDVNYGRADDEVTHRVDIAQVYERKVRALHAHRTQVGPHYPLLYRAALARRRHEHFRLAWSRRPVSDFDDILAPVSA
ncbi:MAG: PIG-L family deacetylase [Pseudonocardia sp.]